MNNKLEFQITERLVELPFVQHYKEQYIMFKRLFSHMNKGQDKGGRLEEFTSQDAPSLLQLD